MAAGPDAPKDALLKRYGRTYADEAGIRLADKPAPLYQLLVLATLAERAHLVGDRGQGKERARGEGGLGGAGGTLREALRAHGDGQDRGQREQGPDHRTPRRKAAHADELCHDGRRG